MTTRSTQLWAVSLVGRPSGLVFTGPAGSVTLLKTVSTFNAHAESHDFALVMISVIDGSAINLFLETLEPNAALNWQSWVVLRAGDQLHMSSDAPTFASVGSGTLLPANPS